MVSLWTLMDTSASPNPSPQISANCVLAVPTASGGGNAHLFRCSPGLLVLEYSNACHKSCAAMHGGPKVPVLYFNPLV